MIKKIISGGQIGAGRAALDVALKFGIPHGGWIPKGRKTENGTLIIARGKLTGGSDYTRQMTLKYIRMS